MTSMTSFGCSTRSAPAIAALREAESGRDADSRWREAFDVLDQADETLARLRYELLRTVRRRGCGGSRSASWWV
jgi:hypothetical protein